jgi:hypothetical protein
VYQPSTKPTSTPTDHTDHTEHSVTPLRYEHSPQLNTTEIKITRRDRLGGMTHEYTQVA